ncbi:MAG: hypothetical protein U5N10_06660 [Gemmobacter sp.]|nr:hypothetical protein [Gemmobacter sp.]
MGAGDEPPRRTSCRPHPCDRRLRIATRTAHHRPLCPGQTAGGGQFPVRGPSGRGAGPVDLWDITRPSRAYEAELHGFAWLDDLAAVGDPARAGAAQGWALAGSTRFGRGRGRAGPRT